MIAAPLPADQPLAQACLLCGGQTQRLFSKSGYWVCDCRACYHRQAEQRHDRNHVKQVYDDSYFFGGGDGYADYLEEAKLLTARGRWYARLLNRWCRPGTVLDVGAAAGFILRGFIADGWTGQGVEPNASMVQYARSRLGLEMAQGTLEDLPSCGPFDLVSMIQVLPHFIDPVHALETAARLTRAGGFWLFETWDRDSWTARFLGPQWHEYSPPSVLHWFSRQGLNELTRRFGFRKVAGGRPPKWISGGHAKSLMRHKLNGSWLRRIAFPAMVLIPDRMVVPYPAEDLFWGLFQRT